MLRHVRFLATARQIPDITKRFNAKCLEIHTYENDIRKYLGAYISKTGSELLEEHKREIADKIIGIWNRFIPDKMNQLLTIA